MTIEISPSILDPHSQRVELAVKLTVIQSFKFLITSSSDRLFCNGVVLVEP